MSLWSEQGVSTQICALKTNKATLAASAAWERADLSNFEELTGGRCNLLLIDFSNGKGEKAKRLRFSLNEKDVMKLHAWAETPPQEPVNMTWPRLHNYLVFSSGPHKGMCECLKLTVTRYATDPNGRPMKYPWKFTFDNGYAERVAGGNEGAWFEKSGSYRSEGRAGFSMSDEDYLYFVTKIWESREAFKRYAYETVYREGRRIVDEANGKGWKQPDTASAPVPEAQTAPEPDTTASNPEPVPAGIRPLTQEEMNAPTKTPETETKPSMPKRPMPKKALVSSIVVDDDQLTVLSNGASLARCTVVRAGKQYKVFFDYLPESVKESVKTKKPVDVVLYMYQGEIHCGGTPDMYEPVSA